MLVSKEIMIVILPQRHHALLIKQYGCKTSAAEEQITLRERLRTIKVFTKDQCFYLSYHKFSIKSYVFGCVLESPR